MTTTSCAIIIFFWCGLVTTQGETINSVLCTLLVVFFIYEFLLQKG